MDIERETRRRLVETNPNGRPTGAYEFAMSVLGGPEEWAQIGVKEMPNELKH
jgi:hypothetical protein